MTEQSSILMQLLSGGVLLALGGRFGGLCLCAGQAVPKTFGPLIRRRILSPSCVSCGGGLQLHGRYLKRAEQDTQTLINGALEDILADVRRVAAQGATQTDQQFKSLQAGQADAGNKIVAIESLLGAVRDFLGTQQDELNRYKDGYDYKVMKSFCLGVIRALDSIDKYGDTDASDTASQTLAIVRDELEILLDSQSISPFSPDVGSPVFRRHTPDSPS